MLNADVKTSKKEIVAEEFQWGIAFLHELRADIRELRAEIKDVRESVDTKYNQLRAEIKDVRQVIDSKYGILDQKFDDLRKEMHRQLYWIIGTMITIAAAIIAVIKI